jgi:hypothetical protein
MPTVSLLLFYAPTYALCPTRLFYFYRMPYASLSPMPSMPLQFYASPFSLFHFLCILHACLVHLLPQIPLPMSPFTWCFLPYCTHTTHTHTLSLSRLALLPYNHVRHLLSYCTHTTCTHTRLALLPYTHVYPSLGTFFHIAHIL